MARLLREEIAVERSPVCIYRILSPVTRRGTILVPPLIGGGGLQQYGYYKDLNREGFELVSFDYRGHGRSGGEFTVRNSVEDTIAVGHAARKSCGDEPLFGMGNCYGSIPLLLAADRIPSLFRAVALFNPIPDLRYAAGPREVFRNYFRPGGRFHFRNPFDLRGIVSATSEILFPAVDRSRNHFGILQYDRVRTLTTALEYFFFRRTRRLQLADLDAMVIYGRSDATLRLGETDHERDYRRTFSRMLPRARFRALEDVDHYWTSCYSIANQAALEFFTVLPDRSPRRAGGPKAHPSSRSPVLLAPR